MFERIIEAIGRFIASLFRKSSEFIEDTKVESNLFKEQAKVSAINAKSTLNISMKEGSYVNYFRNRVIGEFLKVLATLVPYKYEEDSGKYSAYFVRHKRKSMMEYIKFVKNNENDKDADISYTVVNKMLSSTGITMRLGNSGDNVLVVDDAVSSCIYDSISGKKAPLYLLHVLDKRVGVGNPAFVYDAWVLVVKLISKKVDSFLSPNQSEKDVFLVNNLMSNAGIHMFMSYFKSLDNPYYRMYYKPCSLKSMSDGVKYYNSLYFNTNKITKFTFVDGSREKCHVLVNHNKRVSELSLYGATITFTGIITEEGEAAGKRFNYKLAETLIKTDDEILKRNFLFYLFSTGGIDDKDIIELREEKDIDSSKSQDKEAVEFNKKVEPVVKKVMVDSGFKEDESGDLASADFSEFVESDVKAKYNNPNPVVPKEEEPIATSNDVKPSDLDNELEEIEEPKKVEKVEEVKEVKEVKEVENVGPNAIDNLQKQSSKTYIPKDEEPKVENKPNSSDFVRALQQEADGAATTQRPSNEVEKLESKGAKIRYINEIISKPISQWDDEDCTTILGGNFDFSKSNISKQDVLDRALYLKDNRK